MPHFFLSYQKHIKKGELSVWLEQQSIKTAAAVFAQAGRVIDWHSQEEDPVRNSPRGRGTQTHFQAEVYFCMFHSGSSSAEKIHKKNISVSVQIRISASRSERAPLSGSCATARSTVRCHSAHYFKSRECDLQNLHGSIKSYSPFRQLFL